MTRRIVVLQNAMKDIEKLKKANVLHVKNMKLYQMTRKPVVNQNVVSEKKYFRMALAKNVLPIKF